MLLAFVRQADEGHENRLQLAHELLEFQSEILDRGCCETQAGRTTFSRTFPRATPAGCWAPALWTIARAFLGIELDFDVVR